MLNILTIDQIKNASVISLVCDDYGRNSMVMDRYGYSSKAKFKISGQDGLQETKQIDKGRPVLQEDLPTQIKLEEEMPGHKQPKPTRKKNLSRYSPKHSLILARSKC